MFCQTIPKPYEDRLNRQILSPFSLLFACLLLNLFYLPFVHLMNPELNDTGSWEEVNGKAFVRCEDCCVVAQNRKLRMPHPGHLQCSLLLSFEVEWRPICV